jgi:GntR family transcriptional regulator/MocR family aminotransferase
MSSDLDIVVDRSDPGLLSHQIGRRLIDMIVGGALPAGRKLPSTRALAEQIGVARMTVVEAYDWICDLGYAESNPRSGTVVSTLPLSTSRLVTANVPARSDRPPPPRIDFRPGLPDLAAFPRASWASAMARAARRLPAEAMGYGDPLGSNRLREAIAAYLHRSRGLVTTARNIVVTAGTGQSVDLLLRVLPRPEEVVVETPGPNALRRLPLAYGLPLREVGVDPEGLIASDLPDDLRPRLAYVIPSHQMPLGCVMSVRRRLALLEWAGATGAYVVEDDYDSEFAYDGRPSLPLAKLDATGRVIYAGTFSKTLAPALRIGFMVVPDGLADIISRLKWWADHGGSVLQQEALAGWIEDGTFEQHVHRMRKVYRRRFEALTAGLRQGLGERVRIIGAPVGMHLAAFVRTRGPAAELVRRALGCSLGLHPIQRTSRDGDEDETGFVFGFGNVADDKVIAGADLFCQLASEAS